MNADKIEKLAAMPGVLSVTAWQGQETRTVLADGFGNSSPRDQDQVGWDKINAAARELLEQSGHSSVRAIFGSFTVVVSKELDVTLAASFPTGHTVAKSLRRAMRRAAKPGGRNVAPRVEG